MRQLPSLKSTHWVIWSSPLLLLVMVFTLTTSSGSTPRRREALSPTTTTRAVTDPVTSKEVTTTSTTTPPSTLTTTTITKPVTETVVNAPPGPSATNAPRETNSSHGTVSSAKPVANAPAENASSGVLTGQLTPWFAVADVPLDGPGTWNVATNAVSILTLRCANQSISVQAQFVIGAREQCQLIITPATTSTSLTWQLTPVN